METFSRGTPLDPWFLTGLVEGEGRFTYSRSGRNLALYFAIKLTERDRDLLLAVQDYFGGIGKIYRVVPRPPREGQGWTKSAGYYRVTKIDELERIINHFDRFPLLGAKSASYAIWREMVFLKQRFRKPPREELARLAERLSAASPRNMPWSDGR